MVESAALLVDEVLPREPLRQWVLSVPFPLRYLFAADPTAIGAVTLIQRFGSALNLNIHFHLLVRDVENSYLSAGPGEDSALEGLLGHSINYRIAVGRNEGRKAFTLQTLAPALTDTPEDERLAKHSGFSLHAGVAAAAQRHAAAEPCLLQVRQVAQHPQQRRVRFDIRGVGLGDQLGPPGPGGVHVNNRSL